VGSSFVLGCAIKALNAVQNRRCHTGRDFVFNAKVKAESADQEEGSSLVDCSLRCNNLYLSPCQPRRIFSVYIGPLIPNSDFGPCKFLLVLQLKRHYKEVRKETRKD